MQRYRLSYFLAFGAIGALVPFQPMLLHNLGMQDHHLGLLLAAPGVAALLAPAAAAYAADKHLSSRKLLIGAFTLGAAALLALMQATAFAPVAALTLAVNLLYAPAVTLLDVLCLHELRLHQQTGSREGDFPLIRRWGSLGFLAPAVLLAALTGLAGASPSSVYLIGAAFSLAAAWFARGLPDLPPEARSRNTVPTLVALQTLSRPPLGALLAAVFTASIGLSMFYLLMPRCLQTLGLSVTQAGLVVSLGVVWEIVLFTFGKRFMAELPVRTVLILGLGLTVVRFAILALFPRIDAAIATQIFHGPLVYIFAVTIPVLFTRAATPEMRNSLLGLASSIYNGLARVLGPPLAGALVIFSAGSELDQICVSLGVAALLCLFGMLLVAARVPADAAPPPRPAP